MRKNNFIVRSRLREMMKKHTNNEQLVDVCMRVSASMVGFSCENEEDFYKKDRAFMKQLRRIPNQQIDDNPIWLNHRVFQISGPKLIKAVKDDIRDMA